MVSSVADILLGLWAKSSTTVISFAVPTTSSRRRMPLNSPRWAAAAARATPQAFGTHSGESVGHTMQPSNFQGPLDALTGFARLHLEPDSNVRSNRRRRKEVGLRRIQTVGDRLPRLQTDQKCRGFYVIEIQHHRLRLGNETAEKGA